MLGKFLLALEMAIFKKAFPDDCVVEYGLRIALDADKHQLTFLKEAEGLSAASLRYTGYNPDDLVGVTAAQSRAATAQVRIKRPQNGLT